MEAELEMSFEFWIRVGETQLGAKARRYVREYSCLVGRTRESASDRASRLLRYRLRCHEAGRAVADSQW